MAAFFWNPLMSSEVEYLLFKAEYLFLRWNKMQYVSGVI